MLHCYLTQHPSWAKNPHSQPSSAWPQPSHPVTTSQPNAQLCLFKQSTDAQFPQIIVSTQLRFSRESNATGFTLCLRPLLDPHQWFRQQTLREFTAFLALMWAQLQKPFMRKLKLEHTAMQESCFRLLPAPSCRAGQLGLSLMGKV